MEIGFFEKIYAKKLKNSKNKNTIELYINSELDLFSKYSFFNENDIKSGNVKINNELVDYLLNEMKILPLKNALIIKIHNRTKYDIDFIEKLIKNNIFEKMFVYKKIKGIDIKSIILIWIGMILIGTTQIFQLIDKRYPLKEFIIVVSWVFMWKAVDLMFFEKRELIKEKRKLMKVYFSQFFEV